MPIERHQANGLYRTWLPPSFDEEENPAPAPPPEPAEERPSFPTAAEIEAQIQEARAIGHQEGYDAGFTEGLAAGHEQGWQEGFEKGHAEGYAAGFRKGESDGVIEGERSGRLSGYADGYAAGYEAGHQEALALWLPRLQEQTRAAEALAEGLQREWRALPQMLASAVAALAVEIARAVITHELTTRPYQVVHLAEQLLAEELQRPITVKLHPEDLALIPEAFTTDELVRWVADGSLARGSVVLETDAGLVDASLASRWRRAVAQLFPDAMRWEPALLPAAMSDSPAKGRRTASRRKKEPSKAFEEQSSETDQGDKPDG